MQTCPSCEWSRSQGVLSMHRKDWRCVHPEVNRLRPAFLAGDPHAAVRCIAERSSVVGFCGTKGRKWTPIRDEKPKNELEEVWGVPDEPAAEVSSDARGGESVPMDRGDGMAGAQPQAGDGGATAGEDAVDQAPA